PERRLQSPTIKTATKVAAPRKNMNQLQKILANKHKEIAERRTTDPLAAVRARALNARVQPSLCKALRASPMGLIAEIKRKSPSAGSIREPFDAPAIAKAYAGAGVQGISVLMDEPYFGGGEADFTAVRKSVPVPLLYKEFVIDEWQIWHAASLGASAVLLIAEALEPEQLRGFLVVCRDARIEPLVEVHGEEEMRRVADLGVSCIGINNRDLRTFKVTLDTTFHLRELAPPGATVISESGISSANDVARLKAAGVHAVLVGEHLLRQQDVGMAVRDVMSAVWASS
ncbi:MAG TPA: indole-3-glycerol phosphate synthase TrpC, partial [Kiritimatiellia bacterium]